MFVWLAKVDDKEPNKVRRNIFIMEDDESLENDADAREH